MSQIAAGSHGDHADSHAHAAKAFRADDPAISFAPGSTRPLAGLLLLIGLAGLALTVVGGFAVSLEHAEAAYLVGVATVLAMSLGALFFVMAFHLTMAGWSVTVRRQFEHIAGLAPVGVLLFVPVLVIELVNRGVLYHWMDPDAASHDVLAEWKSPYLNITFFLIRFLIYGVVWTYLARKLFWYSTEQDRTGDKWLSNKARFTSSWGMLLFALATAFAAFDWLMSLDYHFYSTMWGVYYFAGSAFSAVSLCVIVLAVLRSRRKLDGIVTEEHFHDLGKFMLVFTVFWAYIAFSQYFLIWYSNIPEETAYYLARKTSNWWHVSTFLVFGHFLAPFFILLWRRVKRTNLIALVGAWLLFMHMVDIFWIVRPMVYAGVETADKVGYHALWVDIAAMVGVLGVFLGLLVYKIGSGPLIPLQDPRLPESLAHNNYV